MRSSDTTAKEDAKEEKGNEPEQRREVECLLDLERTLHQVLDTIMCEAMTRDVVHEVYVPREDSVDQTKVLAPVRGEEDRFPVVTNEQLPNFVMDPHLLRFIHVNALSNACKYGKQGGIISTEVDYNSDSKLLVISIVNEPGEHHAKLVELGGKAFSQVFASGRRLHPDFDPSFGVGDQEVSMSSGDGAWIMSKCATMLGGDVSITFNPEHTLFALKIRAKPVSDCLNIEDEESAPFELPETTWGIVVDDSQVQRKLAGRYLNFIGIEEERRLILGATAEEILGFNDVVSSLVQSNKDDKFLIIVDENLDIIEGNSNNRTVSGSLCIERLRQDLAPEDICRCLCLVRNANDSGPDLEMYCKRAHGYLLKVPLRQDELLQMIRPLWTSRFAPDCEVKDGESDILIISELPPSEGISPNAHSDTSGSGSVTSLRRSPRAAHKQQYQQAPICCRLLKPLTWSWQSRRVKP